MNQKLVNFLEKNKTRKIVFTNGCFDILHRGHVTYLNEAKKCGDVLILGLNSDLSVKRLKGEARPINNELDRQYVLENLECVDHVEIFENDTPLDLIMSIKPDTLVKGGDWKPEDIVGGKEVLSWGGDVQSLNFVNNYSTTGVIEKINAES